MQEMMIEDQMRHMVVQEQVIGQQKVRPRRVKKTIKNVTPLTNNNEEVGESLKNEIEMLPMKTPISILQELLSRRGRILNF